MAYDFWPVACEKFLLSGVQMLHICTCLVKNFHEHKLVMLVFLDTISKLFIYHCAVIDTKLLKFSILVAILYANVHLIFHT